MEEKQLPKEVVERILKARDALVVGNKDEAYHQLYGIASPRFDKYSPWEEMEKQVGHLRLNEQDIINSNEVTAYATKLLQANEAIKVLTYDNNRLNGEVEGYKEACEELKRWKMNAAEELTIVGAYAHKHLEVNQSDSIAQLVMAHLNECRTLLEEVFRKHESGLLPDRFIYEKIKTFLYGG